MVDTEVENILREIRERVYAEQGHGETSPNTPLASDALLHQSNSISGQSEVAETLARFEGHLTTTARAWDRLPPLVSNRSGNLARLELWIKRRLKLATRWYSWEQVNFNAAVHHALKDMQGAFSNLEQQLQRLQIENRALAEKVEQSGVQAQRAATRSLQAEIDMLRAENQSSRAEIESLRAESESQARLGQAKMLELNARLEEMAQESRHGNERLLDEQRVCLRQLSLEIGELNTLLDRARRQIESRLNRLEDQYDQ